MILARIEPIDTMGYELINSTLYTAIIGIIEKDFQRKKWIKIEAPMVIIKTPNEKDLHIVPANVPKNGAVFAPSSGVLVIPLSDDSHEIESHRKTFLDQLTEIEENFRKASSRRG